MAHGDAEPGCADADCRPLPPAESGPTGRAIRRICGEPTAERARVERTDDHVAEPTPDHLADPASGPTHADHVAGAATGPMQPDHLADPASGPMHGGRAPACRRERPGWAGPPRRPGAGADAGGPPPALPQRASGRGGRPPAGRGAPAAQLRPPRADTRP